MSMLEKHGEEKKYLANIIFVMILVGYPIFSGITMALGVDNNSLSIAYRLIVFSAASILLFLSWFRYGLRINYKIFIGAFFLFFYIVRMLLEWLVNSEEAKLDWNDFWSFLLLICLVPALPYMWGKNIPDESSTPNAIIVFGIIGLVLNFYLTFRVGNLSLEDQLLSGRLESERLNPIAYGHLGVSTAVVSLWGLLIKRKINIFTILGVFIGVLGATASGSRGPFLSLAICVLIILTQFEFRANKFTIVLIAAFLMCAILFGLFIDFDSIYILSRVEASMFEDDGRAQIFSGAYHAFLNSIFLGAGYPFDTYPHNIVLEAFMSSGIFGGVLMIATLSIGVMASFRVLKNKNFSWVSLLFIQYLCFSMVSGSIYYSNILWMLWVCVVTLSANRYFSKGN